jgi:hypothetical protein
MKLTIGTGITIVGAIIFIVTALTLVSRHPVILLIMGIGVALYLLGKKLK